MIAKYGQHWDHMYEYISNRLEVDTDEEKLSRELFDEFKPELLFYECNPKMLKEFLIQMIRLATYIKETKKTIKE